ncbi:MAG: hypothetical protein SA398_09715 [Methanosarcina sp.]|nr:hypothetical protein [Methanosarcina sp.]
MDLEILSPNPIGVINRRNGFGSTVSGQRLQYSGCRLKVVAQWFQGRSS